MTVLEALRRVNAYPIPVGELEAVAIKRGLELTFMADSETLCSRDYKLATADLLLWLSEAPNVSQDGISYSFTDDQRKKFKARALAIMDKLGDSDDLVGTGVTYGYKGSVL